MFGKGNLMRHYYEHMMSVDDSLMSRYYGLLKVKLSMMEEPVTFVMMDSLINKDYGRIERLYDLKGATYSARITKLDGE